MFHVGKFAEYLEKCERSMLPLFRLCNRESCCINSHFKINVTSCYIDCVTANLAALILVPSEPDFIRMENSDFCGAASKFQNDC